jgi:hypothetical protein
VSGGTVTYEGPAVMYGGWGMGVQGTKEGSVAGGATGVVVQEKMS